jgi:hypothetical protein
MICRSADFGLAPRPALAETPAKRHREGGITFARARESVTSSSLRSAAPRRVIHRLTSGVAHITRIAALVLRRQLRPNALAT